jgi:hypothetical protein
MNTWEPTRHGGFRRTRVAQVESAAQIKQRSVGRNHPRVPLLRLGWAERLGLPECPYVIRWRAETPIGSVRLHHWLGSDDARAYHDHPFWFVTVCLRGSYTDRNPGGDDVLRPGSVRFRRALYRHTVVPAPGGAWTFLLTGRTVRAWGFWKNGKFRKANKWFASYGHHPCS